MRTGIDAPGTPLVEIMVTEELDAGSEPRVRALLEDALTLHPEQLIIDLAGCPFIDATAIGMLLDIHRQVWTSGGRLTLRAPSPRVRRTLQIAHVNHVLRMVPEADGQDMMAKTQ
ncbi:STAS domain-containing protein [Dactylosporangium aurantiacum]|uniref:Anti-sigma factor antagonist n=1 Tax=Dactylosporangium aurantiacum TaxID=35754 RepID=A0A9Q9ILW3_9ACTN|nr:STAS domain-containing protein [Dactylosporangium aurantiacum]MDG6109960.1 STAS domain-containing protein [Dactylosporangium aurantiacum]UWZ57288.1 STAS domain-containing protein [Dactylosporangium aurantiacum]